MLTPEVNVNLTSGQQSLSAGHDILARICSRVGYTTVRHLIYNTYLLTALPYTHLLMYLYNIHIQKLHTYIHTYTNTRVYVHTCVHKNIHKYTHTYNKTFIIPYYIYQKRYSTQIHTQPWCYEERVNEKIANYSILN